MNGASRVLASREQCAKFHGHACVADRDNGYVGVLLRTSFELTSGADGERVMADGIFQRMHRPRVTIQVQADAQYRVRVESVVS